MFLISSCRNVLCFTELEARIHYLVIVVDGPENYPPRAVLYNINERVIHKTRMLRSGISTHAAIINLPGNQYSIVCGGLHGEVYFFSLSKEKIHILKTPGTSHLETLGRLFAYTLFLVPKPLDYVAVSFI